ncbi:MAG: glutamyl-tRNA reductase [Variovorax sp.]|nr:MAG: glutamyl-tRNA reductase [Variovorax sp.]
MSVWALGLNHTTAPLDLRGRFAFAVDQIPPTLNSLRQSFGSGRHPEVEAAIISTCNRTEIYWVSDHQAALDHTVGWLADSGGVSRDVLRSHTYTLHDDAVARHAFRVASGLDSMVLGEAQILGQMKDAVRAATDIGAHSISIAAAAVRLAGQLFEDLRETRILFVGAGEMIELAATHFAARQPKSITIANRTPERGEQLAARFGGQAMRLADLPARLGDFDIVVSCTASTLPLIGLGAVERALRQRRHRPMFMVDLAVPRDIESEVKDLEDVYLYTVDDLAAVVQQGQASRQAAVAQAEVIIDAGVASFMHWLGQRDTVPLIRQLNAQTEEWRALELARARKLLAKGEPVEAVLEALARGLTQKMLHGAMAELHAGDAESREQTAHTISRLFLRGDAARKER